MNVKLYLADGRVIFGDEIENPQGISEFVYKCAKGHLFKSFQTEHFILPPDFIDGCRCPVIMGYDRTRGNVYCGEQVYE